MSLLGKVLVTASAIVAIGGASGAEVIEALYRSGDVRCRLTWTGKMTGWRLQTAVEGEPFSENGAVQKLAAFMGEAAPSTARKFRVEEKEDRRICTADDGSCVEIGGEGRLDVRSASGGVVTESVSVGRENGGIVLSGRLLAAEPVYGLGERLDRLNKRGQRVALYTSDGYNNSNATYMAIPLFTTHRGGGVFVNLYERMVADFGATEKNVWRMEIEKPTLDAYLFAKDHIPDALTAYTELSGHAAVPPAWSMGPMICRYYPDFKQFDGPFACEYRGMTLRGLGLKAMMERHVALGTKPSSVILEGGGFADLFSDPTRREELKKMVAYLNELGIKPMIYMRVGDVCGKTAPGYRPEFNVSVSVTTNGVVARANTIRVPSRYSAGVNPDMGKCRALTYADITDPAFWDWFVNVVWKDLVDVGIRGAKIDFCELMPEEGMNPGGVSVHYKWKNPSVFEGTAVHHSYPTFFISKLYRAIGAMTKDRGGFTVLSRGGGIGSQRNPYLWAGDQLRLFEKLDDQLLAVLNSGMSGVPFMSYDMAGYQYADRCVEPDGEIGGRPVSVRRSRTMDAKTEATVFRRGVEFTAFTTCVQSHGFVRNAFDFDLPTQVHYRKYMDVHAALSNVIAKLNRTAAETGIPPVRPLVFRYPEDPKVWDIADEFLLGDALLVAPSFSEKPREGVYLPAGKWERVPGLEIPVYIDRSHPDASSLGSVFLSKR